MLVQIVFFVFVSSITFSSQNGVIEEAMTSVVGLYIEKNIAEDYPTASSSSGYAAGFGSGVIMDESGLVLTNAHVVDHAQSIVAQLSDGTRTFANVVGVDMVSDLALLQLEPKAKYHAMKISNSNKLKIGDSVVAIGNPFGLAHSVTKGIVSGLHRSDSSAKIQDYIQLDAPINPGNSGGALVDEEGKLVGINSAIITMPGGSGNIGIGFALPIEIAMPIYKQLKEKGYASPGFLGVVSQNMNENLASAINSKYSQGVMITNIVPSSPADKAKLQIMDVVVSLNDIKIYDVEHLRSLVFAHGQDTNLNLKVIRNGQEKNVAAITSRPELDSNVKVSPLHGVFVMEHDEISLDGIKNQGLRVTQINKDAPALLSGLLPGDIIISVNGVSVFKTSDLDKAFTSNKDKNYLLNISRNHQKFFVALNS